MPLSRASAAAIAVSLLVCSTASANVILYRETFPYQTVILAPVPSQDNELRRQGWEGGNAGDTFNNNPPGTAANNGGEGAISAANPPGSPAGTGVNNNPQGVNTRDSFAFWSQTGISADSFLYTTEYVLQSTNLVRITWDGRDTASTNQPADAAHLAFLIGSNWYISDQSWNHPTVWTPFSVNLADLTFFARAQAGGLLPDGGIAAGGNPLAAGQIDAFGFWWDGQKTATSRIDNFTLVPEPGSLALLGFGLAGLRVVRRRRP